MLEDIPAWYIYLRFRICQDASQNFFRRKLGFYSEGCIGICRARPVRLSHASGTKMAETFTFLREFRSLHLGPLRILSCRRSRPLEAGNFFGSFREFLRSFGVWIRQLRTGRRAPSQDLSTGYPQLSLY